jgi:hypothetical protein
MTLTEILYPLIITLLEENAMLTPEERFEKKITRLSNGCWIWNGRIKKVGYAVFKIDGKETYVHRWSYEYFKEEIPSGFQVDHICRQRACVNPYHLEAVTQRENLLRGEGACAQNARKVKCKHGHNEWAISIKKGVERRRCIVCAREQELRRKRKNE